MQSLSFVAVFLASSLVIAVANSTSESPWPSSYKTTPQLKSTTESGELMNNDAPQQTNAPTDTPATKVPFDERPNTTFPSLIHGPSSVPTTQIPTNNVVQGGGKIEAGNDATDAPKDPKNSKKKGGSGAGRMNSDMVLVGAVVLLVGGLFA